MRCALQVRISDRDRANPHGIGISQSSFAARAGTVKPSARRSLCSRRIIRGIPRFLPAPAQRRGPKHAPPKVVNIPLRIRRSVLLSSITRTLTPCRISAGDVPSPGLLRVRHCQSRRDVKLASSPQVAFHPGFGRPSSPPASWKSSIPSPVPPYFLVVDVSDYENATKISSCFS
jgi:hypothetical protein